jgi:hypothetical protein
MVRRVRGHETPCRLVPDDIAAIDQRLAMLRGALAKNYDRLGEVLAVMKPEERKDVPAARWVPASAGMRESV